MSKVVILSGEEFVDLYVTSNVTPPEKLTVQCRGVVVMNDQDAKPVDGSDAFSFGKGTIFEIEANACWVRSAKGVTEVVISD